MLVLTRKTGESIRITGPCTITIVELEGGKVRIGLAGPASSEFIRTELDQEHGDTRDQCSE